MRQLLLAAAFISLFEARPAAAQDASALPSNGDKAQERIALSTRPTETSSARPLRLACAPLSGQVFDPNGRPLAGATLLVKGTHQVYVTDADGQFLLGDPVYQGQVLTIQAAGYGIRDVSLTDCTLPRLVLTRAVGAHIKRSGKRAGQVTRIGSRSTTLK